MEQLELRNLIEHLNARRELLSAAIADLEQLCNSGEMTMKRPGRKFVDPEERRQISERMKARWAMRRSTKAAGSGAS